MKDPKRIYDIVYKTARAIKKPVTIKIRKGFDDTCINAPEIAKVAEEAGAAAIAVQPRLKFDEDALTELAESIKKYGVIQPIVVKKVEDHYQIIAGERRWRAAKQAGLKDIPVIIKDYDEQQIAEIALIENLQREDLNPIEEAKAYQSLIEKYQLKQEEIAEKVFKSRSVITNEIGRAHV